MKPNAAPTRALVITHGEIAREMINVVEMILGPIEGLEAMSNNGKSAADITQAVETWLQVEGAAFVLIDDYGGSCATAARLAARDRPEVAIIAGVNLAMLLGFVTWRDSTEFPELVRKIIQKSREAITQIGAG